MATRYFNDLHNWLINEEFSSTRQARFHKAYVLWLNLLANPLAFAGFLVVLALVLVAAFAPLLANHDPVAQDLTTALRPPSGTNWFGTDEFGRDVYSRLVYGARTTLYISILVTIIVAPIGFVIGATAGYLGGWIDVVLMRITDIFLSFPSLVLALAFSAALGPGIENAVIAIALTVWPPIARLARAETLTFRAADFVVAAELQGAGMGRILLHHIVPLCAPSIIIRLTLNMSSVILTAAGLGFLGLGAQPPMPEWGAMAASGRQYLLDAWWLTTVPGIAILVVSLAFNLLGESGSGKSTTGRAIMRLQPATAKVVADEMRFEDVDLVRASEADMRAIRGRRISMILQDPKYSLNPVMTVGEQIAETVILHERVGRREARERTLAMLERVNIRDPERVFNLFPHEVSGGMGQRIMISMMLISSPSLIIADEPTSALDVTVRQQVLSILDDLITERNIGLIFISHDLNLVKSFCDRVIIMYAGRIVEELEAAKLEEATHPYTRGLLQALPSLDHPRDRLEILRRDPSWAEA